MCWKIICLLVLLFNGVHFSTGVGEDDGEPPVSEDISTTAGNREGQEENVRGADGGRKVLNSAAVGMAEASVEGSESLPEEIDRDLDVEVAAEPSSESDEKVSASDSESEVESSQPTEELESAVSTESPETSVESIHEPSLEPLEPSTYDSLPEPSAESSEDAYDVTPMSSAESSEDAYDVTPMSLAESSEDGYEPLSLPSAESSEDAYDDTPMSSVESSEPSIESSDPSASESSPAPSQTGGDEAEESSQSLSPADVIGSEGNSSSPAEQPAPSEALKVEDESGQQGGTTVGVTRGDDISVTDPDVEVTEAGEVEPSESHSSSNAGRTAGIVIGVLASVAFVVLAGYGGYRLWQRTGMNYQRGWRPADMELEGIPN